MEDPKKEKVVRPAAAETAVTARAQRRRFAVEYKTAIVREAEQCRAVGEIGELLRREGLFSSQLTDWRRLYQAGARTALSAKRGPKAAAVHSGALTVLERENARLRIALAQAERIIEIRKKVSALLEALPAVLSERAS